MDRKRSLHQSASSSLANQILHGPFASTVCAKKVRQPLNNLKEARKLINRVLLKLPVYAEYQMTQECSSEHQSRFLMFDLIMRLVLDVTVD